MTLMKKKRNKCRTKANYNFQNVVLQKKKKQNEKKGDFCNIIKTCSTYQINIKGSNFDTKKLELLFYRYSNGLKTKN